jgi:hypothetical protein
MPDIDREDAGEPVDIGFPEDVGNADAFAFRKDQRILAECFHLVEIDHNLRRIGNGLAAHADSFRTLQLVTRTATIGSRSFSR